MNWIGVPGKIGEVQDIVSRECPLKLYIVTYFHDCWTSKLNLNFIAHLISEIVVVYLRWFVFWFPGIYQKTPPKCTFGSVPWIVSIEAWTLLSMKPVKSVVTALELTFITGPSAACLPNGNLRVNDATHEVRGPTIDLLVFQAHKRLCCVWPR